MRGIGQRTFLLGEEARGIMDLTVLQLRRMSGQSNRRDSGRGEAHRAQLPLLDRLIDDAPDTERDPPLSSAEAMGALRRGVRRDIEALLNARDGAGGPGRADMAS